MGNLTSFFVLFISRSTRSNRESRWTVHSSEEVEDVANRVNGSVVNGSSPDSQELLLSIGFNVREYCWSLRVIRCECLQNARRTCVFLQILPFFQSSVPDPMNRTGVDQNRECHGVDDSRCCLMARWRSGFHKVPPNFSPNFSKKFRRFSTLMAAFVDPELSLI
jgi:hypothetical protein